MTVTSGKPEWSLGLGEGEVVQRKLTSGRNVSKNVRQEIVLKMLLNS